MRSRWRRHDEQILAFTEVRQANGESYRAQRVTEEERRRAALTVTDHATGVEDARDLLNVLGLIEDEVV